MVRRLSLLMIAVVLLANAAAMHTPAEADIGSPGVASFGFQCSITLPIVATHGAWYSTSNRCDGGAVGGGAGLFGAMSAAGAPGVQPGAFSNFELYSVIYREDCALGNTQPVPLIGGLDAGFFINGSDPLSGKKKAIVGEIIYDRVGELFIAGLEYVQAVEANYAPGGGPRPGGLGWGVALGTTTLSSMPVASCNTIPGSEQTFLINGVILTSVTDPLSTPHDLPLGWCELAQHWEVRLNDQDPTLLDVDWPWRLDCDLPTPTFTPLASISLTSGLYVNDYTTREADGRPWSCSSCVSAETYNISTDFHPQAGSLHHLLVDLTAVLPSSKGILWRGADADCTGWWTYTLRCHWDWTVVAVPGLERHEAWLAGATAPS